jgi:hypothetical protein
MKQINWSFIAVVVFVVIVWTFVGWALYYGLTTVH